MQHRNATWDDTTNADCANTKIPYEQTHQVVNIRTYYFRRGMGKIVSTYFQDNYIWSKVSDHVKVIFLQRLHSAAADSMQVNRRCTTKAKIVRCTGIKTQIQIALKMPNKRMA